MNKIFIYLLLLLSIGHASVYSMDVPDGRPLVSDEINRLLMPLRIELFNILDLSEDECKRLSQENTHEEIAPQVTNEDATVEEEINVSPQNYHPR